MKYHALIVLAVFTAVSCASSAPELTSTADMSTMVAAQKEEKPLFETVYIPKLLRQTVYFETDFVKYQIEYTYNEDLLAETVQKDTYGDIIERTIYEYRGSDKPVKESTFNSSGELTGYTLFEYDIYGNCVSAVAYDKNDQQKMGNSYEFDVDSRKTRWEIRNEDGVIVAETVYIYEDDRLVRIDNKSASGALEDYFELSYQGGFPAKKSYFTAKGVLTGSEEYRYEQGLLQECRYLRANGMVKRAERYEYDEHGSIIKVEYVDTAGSIQETTVNEYEYREETRELKGE